MNFSIVIPAHNEEAYLGKCLDSIEHAAKPPGSDVEVIVVLNRCTDATAQIAQAWGATTVIEDSRNLSRIRNQGAAAASGDVIATIDADSWMTDNTLCEIASALQSGRYIGGGVRIVPERFSLGIRATAFLIKASIFIMGLSGGLYWCRREDFETVGGFNEDLLIAEDLDFARRLKAYGKDLGLKFTTLRRAHITTSCRKFDRFGDWFAFKLLLFNRRELIAGLRGEDHSFANRFFYDFQNENLLAQQDAAEDSDEPSP